MDNLISNTAAWDSIVAFKAYMQILFQVFEGFPPDSTWLSQSVGDFEGQIAFILHPNGDVQAHQWGGHCLRWVNIGQYSYARQRIEGLLERDKLRGQKIGGGLPPNTLHYFQAVAKQREEDCLAMVTETPQTLLVGHPGNLQTHERAIGSSGNLLISSSTNLPVPGVSSQGISNLGYHGYATLPSGERSSFADDPFVTPIIGHSGAPIQQLRSTSSFGYAATNESLGMSQRSSATEPHKPDARNSSLSFPLAATSMGKVNLKTSPEDVHKSSSPGNISGYDENVYQWIPNQHTGQNFHQGLYHIQAPRHEQYYATSQEQNALGRPTSTRPISILSRILIDHDQNTTTTTEEPAQITSNINRTLRKPSVLEVDQQTQELDQLRFLGLEYNEEENEPGELKALVQSSSQENAIPASRNKHALLQSIEATSTNSDQAISDGVDRTRPFNLEEWWNSGYTTRRRQEDYLNVVKKTIQKDDTENLCDEYSLDPALYAVYENLVVYLEETLGQRPRHYFARFKKPPAWCIDRSPEGNNSFFGEDYGAPPARVGRDPRYREPPTPIGFEYQMRRTTSARHTPRLFDTFYNLFARRP